ncbi:hypothetical protein B0T17DRAFT_510385 [Bombardia bombarda]|uniref:Uncharacterized protein n=1 Tax=Bombardia bombarda TaxID=252184 RepID=A0AA40BW77_9PEZI|nr:hypothetical protein B0T17DRAFT_510385 [Bombardia bombarda]
MAAVVGQVAGKVADSSGAGVETVPVSYAGHLPPAMVTRLDCRQSSSRYPRCLGRSSDKWNPDVKPFARVRRTRFKATGSRECVLGCVECASSAPNATAKAWKMRPDKGKERCQWTVHSSFGGVARLGGREGLALVAELVKALGEGEGEGLLGSS